MTITITLADADGGTNVLAVAVGLVSFRQRSRLAIIACEACNVRRAGLEARLFFLRSPVGGSKERFATAPVRVRVD